ncbi:MAG: tRNA (adenosine(37)-N6)-threonylcarbamoyltransferase complex ATPase subunit type 1 TsaE [Acidithiobacillus sp.]
MAWSFPDPEACHAWGERLGEILTLPAMIFLEGDLGVGKTTLARGVLRGFGVGGRVKSPSYTLIETYSTARGPALHLDLYRLSDGEELEFLGIRDYLGEAALWLIEWPERGGGFLPEPDLRLRLSITSPGHHRLDALLATERAASWLMALPGGDGDGD